VLIASDGPLPSTPWRSLDQASADVEVPDYASALRNTGAFRVGIPRAPFYEELHPEVEAAVAAALAVIKGFTASQGDVELQTGVEDSMPILRAEAYAFHEPHVARSPELYQPATLERIRAGAEITAAAYIAARRRLLDLRRAVVSLFDRVDVLVTPTTPVPSHEIADLQARPAELRPWEILTLRNVRPFNALGLPSISVPCGFTSAGLPIGLQITGPPWSEGRILALAHAYERATDWHRRAPRVLAS
jgi:Asp-tRNA(Asn)/Glu-tRNA(Gln) amidotransferase A subunit family amidase